MPNLTVSPNSGRNQLKDLLQTSVRGLPLMFCRNPRCRNFGVAPRDLPVTQRALRNPAEVGRYTIDFVGPNTRIVCEACFSKPTVYSHKAILNEVDRQENKSGTIYDASCPHPMCDNLGKTVRDHPALFWRHGKTSAGRPRFKCKACGAVVTEKAIRFANARREHTNTRIVKGLVNAAGIRNLMDLEDMTAEEVYGHIDAIHRAFVRFERDRLARIPSLPTSRPFHLSIDFQDIFVNWPNRNDRRNTVITSIASACNHTGFIYGHDLAYDPTIGSCWQEFKRLLALGDYRNLHVHRLSSRYQPKAFLYAALVEALDEREHMGVTPELQALEAEMQASGIQPPGDHEPIPPRRGAIVDKSYLAFAHMIRLEGMLPRAAELRFSVDLDGSTIAAVLSVFQQRISDGKVGAGVVLVDKQMRRDEKERRAGRSREAFSQFCEDRGFQRKDREARQAFIEERTLPGSTRRGFPFWKLPIETVYEPAKEVAVVCLPHGPDHLDRDAEQVDLLDLASLHGVDSYFSMLRNRIAYLSRPGATQNARVWHAKAAYSAERVQKVLDIARIYYNFVRPRSRTVHGKLLGEARGEKRTPAERLGIANGPVELKRILYYDR
ncbi:hypothetical protein ACTZWW_19370 [Salinarimonas sp. NSM]|uniref:hypothetical protein n=1 Tax=Salinarimonas sp. NSM TaxID=3458003 RepID=UPI0040368E5D